MLKNRKKKTVGFVPEFIVILRKILFGIIAHRNERSMTMKKNQMFSAIILLDESSRW